jgi:hypothetical protein
MRKNQINNDLRKSEARFSVKLIPKLISVFAFSHYAATILALPAEYSLTVSLRAALTSTEQRS